MEKLKQIIEAQQKGHENEPLYMIGLQLLEIAEEEPDSAELLEKDLQVSGMKLADAAKKLQEYANKNRGNAKCYCISPIVAEKLLREFYGLPEKEKVKSMAEEAPKPAKPLHGFINLDEYLFGDQP